MRPRKAKLNKDQHDSVRDWWRALQPRGEGDDFLSGELWSLGRGERARLRRCADVDELLGNATTLLLADRLIALNKAGGAVPDDAQSYERLAWVAGVLAVVKDDLRDGKSLAWHLGNGPGNERPKMSELRFKAMQRSREIEDLFLQWRRAVKLADSKVDVARLADDLLSWQAELAQPAMQASNSVKFHWAYDYYLSNRDRVTAEEPESNKETSE